MRTVAIIQARMGSTRLPGKVLINIGGQTALCRVVRRLSRAELINEVIIATTTSLPDDAIVAEAARLQVGVFRGSENDVMGRYLGATIEFFADAVVRITSDCPLIDPDLADDVLREFCRQKADFAFNDVPDRLPRGLDVEVFSRDALQKADSIADQPYQREHVTPVFYERPDLFKTVATRAKEDLSHYRWTLDTPQDLSLIRAIYENFSNRNDFTWHEIVKLMERKPELARMNLAVVQKSMHDVAPVSS